MTEDTKKPFVIEFKSYGTTEPRSSYGAIEPRSSIVYCKHGNLPTSCCEEQGTLVASEEIMEADSAGHCHRPRSEGVDKSARRKLIIACIICVVFMVIEVIGGVLSNSLAIATDAAHLLTDLLSFLISLFAIWIAGRPNSQRYSYGWYRAEVIGALASVFLIWVITAILVYLAALRIINNDFELEPLYMLITSVMAIIINLIMGCQLVHGHTHDIISSDTKVNINVRAAFIHVIGDWIQSIGVFVASLMIYFKPEWHLADPICTFIFSIIVLATTYSILKDALLVLMEGNPMAATYAEVKESLGNVEGVVRVHNLRIWALSINKVAMSSHVAIRAGAKPKQILDKATSVLHSKYKFFEITLQIEEFIPEMEDCNQCATPSK